MKPEIVIGIFLLMVLLSAGVMQFKRFSRIRKTKDEVMSHIKNTGTDDEVNPSIIEKARRIYSVETANHPIIHCNRFPAWSELNQDAKNHYILLAIEQTP